MRGAWLAAEWPATIRDMRFHVAAPQRFKKKKSTPATAESGPPEE
jgi:hypothetical protein